MADSISLVNAHLAIEVVGNGYVLHVAPPTVRIKDTKTMSTQVFLSQKDLHKAIDAGIDSVLKAQDARQQYRETKNAPEE